MVSLAKTQQAVSVELEAHHRLCLEVSALQQELNGLKDGSWKKFQRPDPEDKKAMDVVALARAEQSTKMRLCACGCGLKRQCGGSEQESLPPVVGTHHDLSIPPPNVDPTAQRAYHDKLAQPRKTKEPCEEISSRRSSKQSVDPAHLKALAIPREKARELSQKHRLGPVPKLPDLRGLQARVIAADEGTKVPKPAKPPPFISCPAKPSHSFSTPELPGPSKPLGLLPASMQHCANMPRPQRRLSVSGLHSKHDIPGLHELRMRKATDVGLVMSLPPLATNTDASPRGASKQIVRTLDAQQTYIDRRLAAPPKPKRKQDVLVMKLEALRRERLGREEPVRQSSKSKAAEVLPAAAEEPVLPDVNWDLLI
jgi:hypothetical protein